MLPDLTPAQRAAVEHIDGPLLILAGPGSGKTRVITHRIANLLDHGIHARNILALTFTNKAADEMRSRVQQLAPRQPVWMGTFHRFCSRLLREHAALVGLQENFSIYDMDDSQKLVEQAIDELHLELVHVTPAGVANLISDVKGSGLTPDAVRPTGSPHAAIIAKVYPVYQRLLLAANACDFDDLLLHVVTLLRNNPELRADLDERFRYILVDEYQDTNLAQYMIVRALSQNFPNLAVTGDPDQSIYGWRGATLRNILDFEHDYPNVNVVRLEQNYRSTPNILLVADQLIANNVRRKAKALFTENADGPPVRLVNYRTGQQEATHIAEQIAAAIRDGQRRPRDCAIFYRVNAMSRLFERALSAHGIAYQIVHGLEFYQRREIKDVLAYLHLLNNPRNNVAFLRIVNVPPRGIGKTTLEHLQEFADQQRRSLLDAARDWQAITAINKRSGEKLGAFVELIDRLQTIVHGPLEEILGFVFDASQYRDYLASSSSPEDADRVANLDELLSEARDFDRMHPEGNALEQYLEQASLVADTDDWEDESDKVTLMTLHAAKGLEFPLVFIIGTEQGLIPHERNKENPERIEEERRLLFVGMTRARHELQLSWANYRSSRGRDAMTIPSQFLQELPRESMLFQDLSGQGQADSRYRDEYSQLPPEEVEDDSFSPWEYEAEAAVTADEPKTSPATSVLAKVMTAAHMLGESAPRPKCHPDDFHQGMLVTHPEFGSGKIVAVSGDGPKRMAKIRFFGGGERDFRLAFSSVTPLGS